MPDATECQECEALKQASKQAHRELTFYRPAMTSDRRSKSRWFKADRNAHAALECAYNLAEAKYRLHVLENHSQNADGGDLARNLSIVIRDGRLKP